MKPCEFCEREMPKRKGRFCSQICRDAAAASAIPATELCKKSQLIDWLPLGKYGDPDHRGWRRIRHYSIFAASLLFAACASAEVKPSLTVSQAVTNRTKADALTLATVIDPKREPGALAVSGLTVRYLSALSAVESGHNDFASGRHGEIGRFQCMKYVWKAATAQPYAAATNPAIASTVTLAVIRSRTGKDPAELTPDAFARAWHCPSAKRLNREQLDYVTRFSNLCK